MKKEYAFVIEPSEHAENSASSADRWMTCPGSRALSRGVPNRSTAFAAQGTAAHHIGAHCLVEGDKPAFFLDKVALVEGHEVEHERRRHDCPVLGRQELAGEG